VIRTGIIGYSEGNGHPFSFSAIVNGYDDEKFKAAGWPVIHNYLREQGPDRFGIGDARITCAWTQDPVLTAALCAACRIDTACANLTEMLKQVDAVIVARDDWDWHAELAMPFLDAGLAVFVDKPLSLEDRDLSRFEPFLRSGRLMSCSGLRYAAELDALRMSPAQWEIGKPKLVVATVLNDIEKYGIHMIEAVASLQPPWGHAIAVDRLEVPHQAWRIELSDGVPMLLHCLGAVGKTFHLSVFGERGHRHFDLHDNFSAFRRTLEQFFTMVTTGVPAIDPDETLAIMRLIQQARKATA
jgi:Oxidoreductase family, NAD-binding Rossmann fold